jgi:hypothetical protein
MRSGSSRGPAALAGIALGALGLGLVRFVALPPDEPIHFHANWALWLEGERVDFSDDRYMENVSACLAADSGITGRGRVHLHENNADVIHVHHEGVTWAHLLQNLGWAIGPDWLLTDRQELHRNGDGARLTFVVNGLSVPPAHDRLIRPGDRMLISFGDEPSDALLRDRFTTVAGSAAEFDESFDPAGCAGQAPETLGQRLRRAFWL